MDSPGRNLLIAGYGNVDRQDDGVAWHVMTEVARLLGEPLGIDFEDGFFSSGTGRDYSFTLQLVPEMAEDIAAYDRVCFIDAHTGRVPDEIHCEVVLPVFQASPFTHHLTPATLLSMVETFYGKKPETVLFSIRGYEFGFDRSLSHQTSRLVSDAAKLIIEWIANPKRCEA